MNTKYLRHAVTTCGLALLLMLCGTSVETAHAQNHGDVVNGDTLDLGGPSKADVSALEGNVMLNSTSPLSATLQGNISTRVNLFEQPSCLWSYATVAVSENGQAVGGLDKDDFDVQEDDGVCDYFVSQAGTQGGTAQADFVFAVDNSGSMGGDQDDINDALDDFATALDNSGIDFRIGLTRYGQSGFGCGGSFRSGAPIWEDNCNATFYSDAIFYRDDIWTRNIASGSNEPGYEAIVETVNQFPWRSSAQKIVIIVTDESLAQDTFVADESDALTALNDLGATLYGVTEGSQESQVRALSNPTGGDWFRLRTDPWTTILDDITTQIASLYTIGFQPCDDAVTPPMSRNVDITVNSGGNSATISTSYTPGERPQGRRTPTTAAITNAPAGTALTLQLDTRDFVGASVSSAELFYRTTGGTSYTSVAMTDLGSDTFEGTIPAGDVAGPGVDYYFQYTDGTGVFTSPVDDPVANPFQIGVGTNTAPQIAHTKPTTLTNGVAVPISAQVTDDGSLDGVELLYRQQGRIGYQSAAMSNTGGNTYEASIPGSEVTDAGLDYYIAATDDDGVTRTFGTPDFPVVLGGCSPIQQQCPASTLGNDIVDNTARTVTNTITDQDEIVSFLFTEFTNFTLTALEDQGGTDRLSEYTAGTNTWTNTGTAPTELTFTLQAGPTGDATYFLKVENGCGTNADIDPLYDFGLEAIAAGAQFGLEGVYPNPSGGQTTLSFTLEEQAPVQLSVYDVMGRKVATLVDGAKRAGVHTATWDGRTESGQRLASGLYLVRLQAGDRVATQRLTIVR